MGAQKNRLNEMFLLERPKHMFKLIDKEKKQFLPSKSLLNWTYANGRIYYHSQEEDTRLVVI